MMSILTYYIVVFVIPISMARNEWNNTSIYPMVPGHEIIGIVKEVGSRYKV